MDTQLGRAATGWHDLNSEPSAESIRRWGAERCPRRRSQEVVLDAVT